MKLTKPLIIAALIAGNLVAWDFAVRAQDSTNTPPPAGQPGGGMRGRGPTVEQLTKALDLTDDQKPKGKAALDDRDQKIKDLRSDASLTSEDRRAKMKTIREDMTATMKEILTADQFAKWQKMMPGRRPGGGAGAPPAATPPPTGN